MSGEHNPYDPLATGSEQPLTRQQRMLAWVVGLVVAVSAAVTLLAFAFGLLIAMAGRSMPSPLKFSAILSSPLGHRFLVGTTIVLPVALLLGILSGARVMRVQRVLLKTSMRRQELQHQLEVLRQSQAAP
jgi:hypothetical protein